MKEFLELRSKAYSYLIDDSSEDRKEKDHKKCVIKRKLKFEVYKSCLVATQLENKINHLQKNKIDVDSLKKDQKEFLKNNTLILKTQQRLKSEKHNVVLKKLIRLF